MTAMDFEQRLTVLRDRVALDPDAVSRQHIEGMIAAICCIRSPPDGWKTWLRQLPPDN